MADDRSASRKFDSVLTESDFPGADHRMPNLCAGLKERTVPVIDLVYSQLTDVFRIGLIIALVVTMLRTAPVTGRVLPLVAGVLFVAVMLPTTMPSPSASLGQAILAGVFSNAIILVLVLAVVRLVARLRR